MKIKYPICFIASILLFLLTYWSRDYKDTASWTGTACYFVLAYLLLEHYDDGTHTIPIVWCLALGRLLPTIPPLFGNLLPVGGGHCTCSHLSSQPQRRGFDALGDYHDTPQHPRSRGMEACSRVLNKSANYQHKDKILPKGKPKAAA